MSVFNGYIKFFLFYFSCDKAIELNQFNNWGLVCKGNLLKKLKKYDEAM